jgi:hypothetical protein
MTFRSVFVFASYLSPLLKYCGILFSEMNFNYLGLFMLLFATLLVATIMSSAWALASPTPSLSPTPYTNTSRFIYGHGESMCSFNPTLGCAVGPKNVSGLVVLDKQTGQIYQVQPFRDGLPLCSDPAYVVGALGSSCYDDGNLPTPTASKPVSPLPSTSPQLKSK